MESRLHQPRRIVALLLLAAAVLISITPFPVASPKGGDRPRIALVLGGGGARGFAHLGVIKWLEENRIPVDSVAGTSMGGLVGSLYALGMTPTEVEEILDETDWSHLFKAAPPFDQLQFRRKQDSMEYPTKLELGWNQGISIPKGLNAGHFIGLLFDRIALPYWSIDHFDQLPIPFRCVAVNMETGKQVVLASGSLSLAIRATIAIPGVFNPVEREGQLLADGGLLNNVPADVGRSLGADIVIAVDVGSTLEDKTALSSLLGVIDQSLDIMILDNVRRTLKYSDVVIVPELSGFETMDFELYAPIVESGYEAAASKASLLGTLSLNDSDWKEHLNSRYSRRLTQHPAPQKISIEGVSGEAAGGIADQLADLSGTTVDPETVEGNLTDLYGSGRYYSVGYEVKKEGAGSNLVVRANEKSYGPPFLRFGLAIDGSELDAVKFGIRSRLTFLDLGKFGSELRLDGALGSPLFAKGEYYYPVTGPIFLAGRGYSERQIFNLFSDGNRVAEYSVTASGFGIDTGIGFGQRSDEIRIGYDLGRITSRIRIGDPLIEPQKGKVSSARLLWDHNELDHPTIPSSGWSVNAQLQRFFHFPGASERFWRTSASFAGFKPLTGRDSLFMRLSGGTSFDADPPPAAKFTLGGPLRLGAFASDELRGSRFVYGSPGVLHRISDASLLLGGAIYIGGWYEFGTALNRGDNVNWSHSASGGLIIDSFVGPLFLGGSWSEGGSGRVYFAIGTLF